LRSQIPKWQYKIVSLTFIAFIQNILLWAVELPQYLLMTARPLEHPSRAPPALGLPDLVLAGLFVGILALEQVADEQQQAFQNWKRSPDATSTAGKSGNQVLEERAKVNRGFRTDGLFAWSRHPNFACEVSCRRVQSSRLIFEQVSHWYILYLFTLRATVPTSVYTNLFTGLQQVTEQAFSRGYLNTSLLKSLYKQAGACLLASRS
jgi:steroid 5-alpha reductase family enzyme